MVDAIDEEGSITELGKRMAALPLEPSLARALLAADDLGCLDDALTVAAMLSCESIFSQSPGQGRDRKRIRDESNLPDGGGLGDHIQYFQIYEAWRQHDYDFDWCKRNGLQIRAMKFAKDVRKQLGQIIQRKKSYPEEDRHTSRSRRKSGSMRSLKKALSIGFANHRAHRLPRHNGYRTIGHKSQLVQVHPLSCPLEVNQDGLTPEWVLYHELISTSHPFIRPVCAVEGTWVEPVLKKLEKIDISRLSGRNTASQTPQLSDGEKLNTAGV